VTFAGGFVLAWVGLAWVDGDIALVAGEAVLAEAGKVASAGLVLAHGAIRARVVLAVRLFDLAVDAGVAFFTLASAILQNKFEFWSHCLTYFVWSFS
jgi:hypothetical protein